jgi:hypothetical protein
MLTTSRDEVLRVLDKSNRGLIEKIFSVPRNSLPGADELRPMRCYQRRIIDWTTARKMRLDGGTGGTAGETVYVPRPGITVSSSAPVYNNNHMGYLFNGEPTNRASTEYWLTESSGLQTLTLSFEKPVGITLIRACATTDGADHRSNYRLTVISASGRARMVSDGFVDTENDIFGIFHTHVVRAENVIQIVIELTQEGSIGVCLKKIEIWAVE